MAPPASPEGAEARRITPMVRATHNQVEIDFLPPYGDPEVSIPGELATYVLVGGLVVELLDRVRD